MGKKIKVIQYKANGKPRYIRSGTWTWETMCPKHLPMTLQKLGYKLQEIRGFDIVK